MLGQERFAWDHIEKRKLNYNSISDPTLMELSFKKAANMDNELLKENTTKMISVYGGGEYLKSKQEIFNLLHS